MTDEEIVADLGRTRLRDPRRQRDHVRQPRRRRLPVRASCRSRSATSGPTTSWTLYRDHPTFTSLRDTTQYKGRCGRCPYVERCGGSRARAYAWTGDVLETDPLCPFVPPATPARRPSDGAGDGPAASSSSGAGSPASRRPTQLTRAGVPVAPRRGVRPARRQDPDRARRRLPRRGRARLVHRLPAGRDRAGPRAGPGRRDHPDERTRARSTSGPAAS